MAKKLYNVVVSCELVVFADNEHEATEIARDTDLWDLEFDYMAGDLMALPSGWETKCLVYHQGDEDITVGELIEKGHAPLYHYWKKIKKKVEEPSGETNE